MTTLRQFLEMGNYPIRENCQFVSVVKEVLRRCGLAFKLYRETDCVNLVDKEPLTVIIVHLTCIMWLDAAEK
jgi:hypothetical protein